MANVHSTGPARPSLEIIRAALRAAATAPTYQDALDITGEALCRLAAQKELVTVLREGGIQMDKMAGAAGKLGGGAFGAAGHLANGNGLAAIETAIGALGGLIPGLGKIAAIVGGAGVAAAAAGKGLADDAVGDERSARGAGVSTGQYRSFALNLGRYVDPSMLERTANAQSDLTKLPMMAYAAGVSLQEAQSMDPAELSKRIIKNERAWAKNAGPGMFNQQIFNAMGFGTVSGFDDARRLKASTDDEMNKALSYDAKDTPDFDIGTEKTDKLFGLSRGIDEKTMQWKTKAQRGEADVIGMFTGDVKGAAPAIKELGEVTHAAAKGLMDLINSVKKGGLPHVDHHATFSGEVDKLKHGAKVLGGMFANAISTDAFAKKYPGLANRAGPEAVRLALESQAKYGVPAEVTLAQYGVESGYGTSGLFKRSNNPFGMQATDAQARAGVPWTTSTDHHADGRGYQAKFRRFNSMAEAFDAHGKLLAYGGAYAEARRHLDDPAAYAEALTHHYAEDEHYGRSLINQMRLGGYNPDPRARTISGKDVNTQTQKIVVEIRNHAGANVAVSTNAAHIGS